MNVAHRDCRISSAFESKKLVESKRPRVFPTFGFLPQPRYRCALRRPQATILRNSLFRNCLPRRQGRNGYVARVQIAGRTNFAACSFPGD